MGRQGVADGLKDNQIPFGARIMAVADAFDAMTSDRPYRSGMSIAVARQRLIEGSGSQFWPPAVAAFVTVLDVDQRRGEDAFVDQAGALLSGDARVPSVDSRGLARQQYAL